jgi:hypothetical protein
MTGEYDVPPQAEIDRIVRAALAEDIGDGDVTTDNTIPENSLLNGRFLAKETGVVAGIRVAWRAFALLDSRVEFRVLIDDGQRVERGQILAHVSGPGRAILSGERVSLNFLQRMSGATWRPWRERARSSWTPARLSPACACSTSGPCGWVARRTIASGSTIWC